VLRSPGGLGAADRDGEIAQDVGARLSVAHLGVELHGEHLLRRILDGGDGIRRTGSQVKAGGQLRGFVAVRHPDVKLPGYVLKQERVVFDFDVGVAVFTFFRREDLTAEDMHHQL
jgi:hypothetical protein